MAANNNLVDLMLMVMGKAHAKTAGFSPTCRYLIGKAPYSVELLEEHADTEFPMYTVDELNPENQEFAGISLNNRDQYGRVQTITVTWDELRPIRAMDIKRNEICVAIVFNDAVRCRSIKRWKLKE
jgi:hypothetical protein